MLAGMRAYSVDLRERVVAAAEAGAPRKSVAATFGVGLATVERWLRLKRESGGLAPRPIPGRPSRKGKALDRGLPTLLEGRPDATLPEHCAAWEGLHGERVSESTMSRAIARLGWPLKKRP